MTVIYGPVVLTELLPPLLPPWYKTQKEAARDLMASTKRSNGEGSIYQRHTDACPKAGRCKCPYQGAIVTGWRGDKPIRKKVSGPSRTSVATKMRDIREKVATGQLPHGRVPTLAEWLTYWLEQIVPIKATPGTQRTYRTHVDRYLIPLLGHIRIDKLAPEDIHAAWQLLETEGAPDCEPLSPTTIHHTHAILARALKVATQRQIIMTPATSRMDAPVKDPQDVTILTKTQALQVIDAARHNRNAARWTVAFALGLRQGEALGLRWEDIDLDAGLVVVRKALKREKGKGLLLGPVKGKKPRTIALPAPLVRDLELHREAQAAEREAAQEWWREGDYVFAHTNGRPIDPKDDWTTWRDLLRTAGLEHVKLHSSRHTAGTMMIAMGVPIEVVAEILGHSDLRVTRGYTHRVDDLHLDAARKIGEFWN